MFGNERDFLELFRPGLSRRVSFLERRFHDSWKYADRVTCTGEKHTGAPVLAASLQISSANANKTMRRQLNCRNNAMEIRFREHRLAFYELSSGECDRCGPKREKCRLKFHGCPSVESQRAFDSRRTRNQRVSNHGFVCSRNRPHTEFDARDNNERRASR